MEWHHNVWYSTYLNTILTECEYYESLDCLKHNFKEQSTIKHYFGLIWKKKHVTPLPTLNYYIITVFTVFRLLTDFVCLYNYEFWLSLCKIVRSSVILLLPLLTGNHSYWYLLTGSQSNIFWQGTSHCVMLYCDREPVFYILTWNQSYIFWQGTSLVYFDREPVLVSDVIFYMLSLSFSMGSEQHLMFIVYS